MRVWPSIGTEGVREVKCKQELEQHRGVFGSGESVVSAGEEVVWPWR